ncbi:MAG: hypothetical protein ACM3XO_03565 [Bacteroidota bacterium]|jgi:hypothetical protein
MKTLLTVAIIALAVVGLVFGWFYIYGPCGTNVVGRSISELQNADSRYADAFQVASTSSRAEFAGSISRLQKIEQATGRIHVPACLEPAKIIFVKGMQEGIAGLTASSRQSEVAKGHLHSSTSLLKSGTSELVTISECAPFCITNRNPASPRVGKLP